ncbi:hypothetical protein L2755_02265 [Shewanella abyssi]|uniref:hypothetical protein n=1 Tax=Shewanella abyssi TaxID=311789 RepID=UPI00200CBA32|nr:hypothetical protein [Shewanella abyssi]MCL1048458.1 hypothetical protein [Shewanella abyssi]
MPRWRETFDIKRPLYKNAWFWVAILFPPILAGTLALGISYSNNLYLLSYSLELGALETFYNYQKIPIAVAALIFPFSALVIAHHRSALTLEQIKKTEEQKTFANYLKHKEEFFKCLDNIETKSKISFKKRNELYKILFPYNSFNTLALTSQGREGFASILVSVASSCNSVLSRYNSIFSLNDVAFRNCLPENYNESTSSLFDFYYDILCAIEPLEIDIVKPSNEKDWIYIGDHAKILYWIKWVPIEATQPLLIQVVINDIIDELALFCMVTIEELNYINGPAEKAAYRMLEALRTKKNLKK